MLYCLNTGFYFSISKALLFKHRLNRRHFLSCPSVNKMCQYNPIPKFVIVEGRKKEGGVWREIIFDDYFHTANQYNDEHTLISSLFRSILKRMLQNCWKILKKCFLVDICIIMTCLQSHHRVCHPSLND